MRRGGEGEKLGQRLHTEHGAQLGARSHHPGIRPEPKPRVRHSTDCTTRRLFKLKV